MKKNIVLAALLLTPCLTALAQCNVPLTAPFIIDAQSANVPALPECIMTDYTTFASAEVFKTTAGPIEGFSNNVFVYNAVADPQFDPETYWHFGVKLYTPQMALTAGEAYTLSYKYGNGNSQSVLSSMKVYLMWNNILISSHENIAGTTVQEFETDVFTVPSTGVYQLMFEVSSIGNQGLFYIDDIAMESHGVMAVNNTNALRQAGLYPNPAKDTFTITGIQNLDRVEMHTATGQCVFSGAINPAAAIIDISGHAAGLYFVTLHSGGNKKTIKLIKT